MISTFLFEKFKNLRQFYSSDQEFIKHLLSGEVNISLSDAIDYFDEYISQKPKLPSKFQLGDGVRLDFGDSGILNALGEVIKVHFTSNKILYDVEILVEIGKGEGADNYYTRLYNIDSVFVKDGRIPVDKL